jgi:ankyrin repeat protein
MLKAGAHPKSAWGTSRTGPKESFWQTVTGPSRRGGATTRVPLSIAMSNSVPAAVRALIDAGADPRDANSGLSAAVEAGEVEIVHMVVDAGADVNTTANGTTPLLAAIETRNVALMTYLESHGAREKP